MNRSFSKILLLFLAILPSVLISQTGKTFNDKAFYKGDIIRVPNLDIELLNNETDVKNDSLEALYNFLQAHPDLKFELACHTDSRGNSAANLQSSQYRAEGIRKYLIKNKHINPDMLTAVGYGKSKLLVSDQLIANAKTKEEKERLYLINRRIELIVLNGEIAPVVVNTPVKKPSTTKASRKKSIAGNLLYGENSQYLANTKINCLNDKKEIVKTTTTNSFGAFAFNNVEIDNFYLKKADGEDKLKPNTKISITNKEGKEIQSSKTDDKGDFIFEFTETNKAALDVEYHDLQFDLKGKVVKQDKLALSNGTLNLVNEKGETVATAKSDKDGNFQFLNLRANQEDLFKVNSPETKFINFEQLYLADENGNIIRSLPLDDGEFKLDADQDKIVNDPWMKVLELKNANSAESIKIVENIYYNTGEYKLLPETQVKLDKLIYIMKNDPQLMAELSSHTDSHASADFNMKLSEQRANVAVEYIVSKGVGKDRVTGKGFGETKLINKCADGVECTEDEHAKNRRIEFRISRKK